MYVRSLLLSAGGVAETFVVDLVVRKVGDNFARRRQNRKIISSWNPDLYALKNLKIVCIYAPKILGHMHALLKIL